MKKPKTATAKKGTAKKPPAWAPVSVAAQVTQHRAALKAAVQAAAAWKPVPVAVQIAQHKKATAKKGTVKKAAAVKTARKLPLGGQVACCAAEALAASLRLAGHPVGDADVLALYRRTAAGPDDGAPIAVTLEAAAEYGLAGIRPLTWGPGKADIPGLILGLALAAGPHAVLDDGAAWWSWGEPYDPDDFPGAVIEEAWAVTW